MTGTANENLSPREALHNDRFSWSEIPLAPVSLKTVELSVDIKNVQFDHMKNIMKTRGKMWYKWQDDKMIWDPEKYGNIKTHKTNYHEHVSWLPILGFPE